MPWDQYFGFNQLYGFKNFGKITKKQSDKQDKVSKVLWQFSVIIKRKNPDLNFGKSYRATVVRFL